MKIISLFVKAAVILVIPVFMSFQTVSWSVKEDYSVTFTCGGAHGKFKGLNATLLFDEAHPERSTLKAMIDARTVETGNDLMNEHAREKTVLDTDKFPTISFVSTNIRKASSGYEATGILTLKGISKTITIPFFFSSKNASDQFPFVPKETFSGKFFILTSDFNITRKALSGEIIIELTIPVKK